MSEIFSLVMGMSLAGSAAILCVLLIRQLFRPSRRICCAMWLLAGLRLLMPFSITDAFDVQLPAPAVPGGTRAVYELISPDADTVFASTDSDNGMSARPADSEIPAEDPLFVLPSMSDSPALPLLWLAGAAAVALGVAAGYVRLRLRLRTAVRMDSDIYQSEHIPTPFVLGVIRPRIYIPYSVADSDIPFVLEHERNHIKRNDHISKAAALAVLAVHWFNPLVWAAYVLFCRDTETACDEKVIAHMDLPSRRQYSAALLACSTGTRLAICPVAFGEVGVKERIKHIMKYTKPAFPRNLLSSVLCIALVLCAFALPVGCAEASAAPGTLVFDPVDYNAPSYEGTDRVVNEDGSITMLFVPYSNVSSDSIQTFYYAGNGSSLTVEPTNGFVTSPDENGRIIYLTQEDVINGEPAFSTYLTSTDSEGYLTMSEQGTSLSVDSNAEIVWIPGELNFGSADGKIDATITFISDGDTATVTITTDTTAVTPEGTQALTIRVDDGHTLRVDGSDISRAIIIEKAE